MKRALMARFKSPTFQHRAGQAAQAKRGALDQFSRRPTPDEASVAQRKQSAERQRAIRADKAAARIESALVAEAAKAEAAAKASLPIPTEAERKARRDARYAARKSRSK